MNHPPICYIAGSLPLPPSLPLPVEANDLVIAADGGYSQLVERGIQPHLVVGDFDSAPPPQSHQNVTRLPVEKDDTDMGYAIGVGRQKGYQNFLLLGGLGGLLDHTVANLQHLHGLSKSGCSALLVGDCQCATVLTDGTLSLSGPPGGRCSIFALGQVASDVTLKHLHYTIENSTLSSQFPLGVSNAFTATPATISVQQGSLLVIWEWCDPSSIHTFFTHKEI